MLAMPLPFMRGFGLGGLVIPMVSIVCALTLLPVSLYLCADGLDRVRVIPKAIAQRRADEENNMWARLARAIMRQPLPFALGTTALLIAAAIQSLRCRSGQGRTGDPSGSAERRGLERARDLGRRRCGGPDRDRDRHGPRRGVRDPEVRAAVGRLVRGVEGDRRSTGVAGVDLQPPFVDPSGRYIHLQVVGRHEYGSPEAMDFARRLRGEIVPAASFPAAVEVFAGGGPPSSVDVIETAYSAFPWLVAAVLVLTYFLLLRAFRSLLLPLKAIILNLLAIGAAYGLLVAVFKYGGGEILGIQSFDQIEFWIPIFLFAMLFGLSMDYEVFLVSRMREEWDRTHDNEQAVALGLAKKGGIVTAAGLIMFAAFTGFVVGSILGLQQFGFGLAVAILIDVTVIRALLMPSAMKLFGRWNWWLPPNVARLARVKSSPLDPKPAASPSGRWSPLQLEVLEGDISSLEVDAIANAANDRLWMGSGVAGAIKRAGGEEIEREAVGTRPDSGGRCGRHGRRAARGEARDPRGRHGPGSPHRR